MENIIFDVGQVLVKYDWETYLDSFGFPKEERDKIAEVVFQSNTWNERDRSSETEQYYVDQMVKAAPEYEKDIREVMRRSDETIEKTDYAETWVRYLKDKGYHVYILSNYATDTLERTEDKLTFLKYVDGAVFSCQVKQIKPEPEFTKPCSDATILTRRNPYFWMTERRTVRQPENRESMQFSLNLLNRQQQNWRNWASIKIVTVHSVLSNIAKIHSSTAFRK